MQVHVASELKQLLDQAFRRCRQEDKFFLGIEDVFPLCVERCAEVPRVLSPEEYEWLQRAVTETRQRRWQGPSEPLPHDAFYTPRLIHALQQAVSLAEHYQRGNATVLHLLIAILNDSLSAPSRCLDRRAGVRARILAALRRGIGSGFSEETAAGPDKKLAQPAVSNKAKLDASVSPSEAAPEPSIGAWLRDLTTLAREGKLEIALGREHEMFEVAQVLVRKNKNNVMLVGDAGVGKTAVVEGLAVKLVRNELPGVPSFRIFELNVGALLAGTQYRGAMEERLLALLEFLKRSPEAVLFIDEIHLLMGAGSTENSSVDVANLLKPELGRGEIRVIGATTLAEYRRFIEQDPAIERRFQMVRIEELSPEDTRRVLEHLKPSLEAYHHVKISPQALEAAVFLPMRFLPDRRFPDKAIDVLDQACARFRLKIAAVRGAEKNNLAQTYIDPDGMVTPHEVRKVVSQLSGIPVEELTAEERRQLTDLERRLKAHLVGQDEAISRVAAVVRKARAGLADPNRPDASLLFTGPTGVGKTQLAHLLAELVFGSRGHLIQFNMSEYSEEHTVAALIGAPPGYVGHEKGGRLIDEIRRCPFCVLLFDEIEKAHPRIFDLLLPVLEEGRLRGRDGKEADFRHSIIVLTSNIGAELLLHRHDHNLRQRLIDELRKTFRPEFINRLDEIVPFYPILAEDVREIITLEIRRLEERLAPRRIRIRVYQWAYEHLAEQANIESFGAREVRRTVERLIANPVAELIMQRTVKDGDLVEVLMDNDRLVIRAAPSEATSSSRGVH